MIEIRTYHDIRWLNGKLQQRETIQNAHGLKTEWVDVPRFLEVVCPKCNKTGLETTDDVHRVNPIAHYCDECRMKIARGE